MAKPKAGGTVKWTGKNLAEVRQFHRGVAHYPEKPGSAAHYRDWSQHPDNLHVTTHEGHTVIAEIGDSIVRSAGGQISVQKSKAPRAPRALRPAPPSPGRVIHASAGGRNARAD